MTKDIHYQLLKDTYDAVGNLREEMTEWRKGMEKRVSTLESFKDKILGICLVFGAFAGTAASWVWNKLTKT